MPQLKIACKKVEGTKGDKYDIKISTYKSTIEGRFDKEDMRHLVEVIDNEII